MDIEKIILRTLEDIEDIDNDFYKLWLSKKHFQIHIDKRKEMGHTRDKSRLSPDSQPKSI